MTKTSWNKIYFFLQCRDVANLVANSELEVAALMTNSELDVAAFTKGKKIFQVWIASFPPSQKDWSPELVN